MRERKKKIGRSKQTGGKRKKANIGWGHTEKKRMRNSQKKLRLRRRDHRWGGRGKGRKNEEMEKSTALMPARRKEKGEKSPLGTSMLTPAKGKATDHASLTANSL